MMGAIDLAEIKAAAEKATPGPWQIGRLGDQKMSHVVDFGPPPKSPYMVLLEGTPAKPQMGGFTGFSPSGVAHADDGSSEANAAFIALCDPTTILALVTELQQHRADPSSGKGEAVAWRHNLTGIIRTDKPGLGLYEDYTPLYEHHTPKATAPVTEEQVEAARHWIDRYAAGIDEEPQMSRIVAALASPAPAATVPEGWQRAAMDETIRRIGEQPFVRGELYDHIEGMPGRMTPDFSQAKIGRWLGWVQGAACIKGWLTLDDCKAINKAASEALSPSPAPTNTTESDHG